VKREIGLETASHAAMWRVARGASLLGALALAGLLLVAPDPTLAWLWNLVIPLLPATFLVTPSLWRNVCPLATLNEMPVRGRFGSRIPPGWLTSGVVAAIALAVLIPARRVVLNASGPATAGAIAGLGLVALAGGVIYAARSGFCNSLCPILPVERLYGQHPMLELAGSRCATCTFCSPRGCMDLARDKAMAQILGPARHSARWLLTPMGAFGAAFPGLVLAYFTTPDAVSAWVPFARSTGFAGGSYAAVAIVVLVGGIRGASGMTGLAALSFGLYYWFAPVGMAAQLGIGSPGRDLIRGSMALLLTAWLVLAVRRLRRPPPRLPD